MAPSTSSGTRATPRRGQPGTSGMRWPTGSARAGSSSTGFWSRTCARSPRAARSGGPRADEQAVAAHPAPARVRTWGGARSRGRACRMGGVCARRARSRLGRDRPGRGFLGGGWRRGAVAAVQLARLAGECVFLTALGDDELGRLAKRSLERLGVRIEAVWRPVPQRRAFVHTDMHAERTITVLGDRIGPRGDDALPWDALEGADGVYLTAGDPAAAQAARRARRLVATVRAAAGLAGSEVQLDALVASAA